jgi:hypothetical protein
VCYEYRNQNPQCRYKCTLTKQQDAWTEWTRKSNYFRKWNRSGLPLDLLIYFLLNLFNDRLLNCISYILSSWGMSTIHELGNIRNELIMVCFCGLVNRALSVVSASDCRMNDELERSDCGLDEALSRHLPGRLRKTMKVSVTVASDPIYTRTEHFPNAIYSITSRPTYSVHLLSGTRPKFDWSDWVKPW